MWLGACVCVSEIGDSGVVLTRSFFSGERGEEGLVCTLFDEDLGIAHLLYHDCVYTHTHDRANTFILT